MPPLLFLRSFSFDGGWLNTPEARGGSIGAPSYSRWFGTCPMTRGRYRPHEDTHACRQNALAPASRTMPGRRLKLGLRCHSGGASNLFLSG